MMQTTHPVFVTGTGLITGQPVSVEILPAPAGTGVVFVVNGTTIPATPQYVVNTDRGVTLAHGGQPLSIVEHFLSAVAMVGLSDLTVTVTGAPELPLLDGSAAQWVEALRPLKQVKQICETNPFLTLTQPILHTEPANPGLALWAFPADSLSILYAVNFAHPALENRWLAWTPESGTLETQIAPARTFGFVSELPALQARGLALGVTPENTLGLTDDGGFTSPLRMPDEPIRHKILDLIGDLMLCGVPIERLKARIGVQWGGHHAHLAFGQQLAQALQPQE